MKSLLYAKESVWWPDISDDIDIFIYNCDTGCRDFPFTIHPMIPTDYQRPWEKIASDFFEFNGIPLLLIIFHSKTAVTHS